MTEWAAKRFWTDTSVAPQGAGFQVLLDGRSVRTPAKALLLVPTRPLAEAIAAEWDGQEGRINPVSMPMTRSANAAIDKVSVQKTEVADMLAEYAGSDLLCYRADTPVELAQRQGALWDPLLDWVAKTYGSPMNVTAGIVPVAQPAASLALLRAEAHALDEFELTAFHDLVTLSGSFVIALAVLCGIRTAADAWHMARVDEDWQEERWGVDQEAQKASEEKRVALGHAQMFLNLVRDQSQGPNFFALP